MPVYQYACTQCSDQLEVRQSFTDDALTVCPACEGRLRKVLSAVGVVFKGSGFYRTDSRSASNGDGDGAPSSDGAKDSEKSSGPDSGNGASKDGAKESGKDSGSGSGKRPSKSDTSTPGSSASTDRGSTGARSSRPAAKDGSSSAGSGAVAS